jgi:hypothetical protein
MDFQDVIRHRRMVRQFTANPVPQRSLDRTGSRTTASLSGPSLSAVTPKPNGPTSPRAADPSPT